MVMNELWWDNVGEWSRCIMFYVSNQQTHTWTLWAGINWTIFADVAKTAPDGEASCWCCCWCWCWCCCCCWCWWWCNADANCDCCDWCADASSVLLCVLDADSPPIGSWLELPFSSTMLLAIATQLPHSYRYTNALPIVSTCLHLIVYTWLLFKLYLFVSSCSCCCLYSLLLRLTFFFKFKLLLCIHSLDRYLKTKRIKRTTKI